jgi:lysozyme family protein
LLSFLLLLTITGKSASFDVFFFDLIALEGHAFTNIKYDRGGATKFGITFKTLKLFCEGKEISVNICDKDNDNRLTTNDLRLTVLQDVKPIYKTKYWDVLKADKIESQLIAEFWTDLLVNSGVGINRKHIKLVQSFVGVSADGFVGNKTVTAVNLFCKEKSEKVLFDYLFDYRNGYFERLVKSDKTQSKFLKGWKNRINFYKTKHYDTHQQTNTNSTKKDIYYICIFLGVLMFFYYLFYKVR